MFGRSERGSRRTWTMRLRTFAHVLTPILAISSWVGCAPSSPPATASVSVDPVPVVASRAERRELSAKGLAALNGKDFAGCARLYEAAGDLYSAASCHSQGGNPEVAFSRLSLAID